MGDRRVDQAALFYEFSLERHVPADHRVPADPQRLARRLARPGGRLGVARAGFRGGAAA